MRTLVIGDIHGGLRALEEVLEKAKIRNKDTLIFLGDYVDGWSQSAETITYLLELRKKTSCIFIRGNHDELLYNYLKHGQDIESWRIHGGEESIESYRRIPKKDLQLHLSFLEELKYYYVDAKNRLFVHGGFSSHHGQNMNIMLILFAGIVRYGKQPVLWIKIYDQRIFVILTDCDYTMKFLSDIPQLPESDKISPLVLEMYGI